MEHRLATIVVADVIGDSGMIRADQTGTRADVQNLQSTIFEPAVDDHGGRLIKTMGDALVLEFPSAVAAVECAVFIQRALIQHALTQHNLGEDEAGRDPEQRLQFRMGIGLGDISVEGDDIQGDGFDVATHLAASSEPDGILLSGRVYEEVNQQVRDIGFACAGQQTVQNITEPVPTFKVLLDSAAEGDGLGADPDEAPARRSRYSFMTKLSGAMLLFFLLAAVASVLWSPPTR